MSAAIDKRLEKLEASIKSRLDGLGVALEEVNPLQVLEILSESYRTERISGLPVAKRKDHLQVVYRFTPESMDNTLTWGHKNVGCISIWRLLVVPGDFAWVIGVNFYFTLSDETERLGHGIISCENPDDVDAFLCEIDDSQIGELLTSVQPVFVKLIENVIGCRGEFVSDPKYDVVVTFECAKAENKKTIIELFDIVVRHGHQDLLGLAKDKTLAQRTRILFDQLEDKLSWTQEHGFVVVHSYAHLLYHIKADGPRTELHFVVDAYRYHFCRQISAMLKELGANKVSIRETPVD